MLKGYKLFLLFKMWSSIDYGYVDSVKKALEEIGRVCPRCILRLAGIKNSREHKSVEPEILKNEAQSKEV